MFGVLDWGEKTGSVSGCKAVSVSFVLFEEGVVSVPCVAVAVSIKLEVVRAFRNS